MPAAQTGTGIRRWKLLSRWNWHTVMPNQHVLALSDPALGLDDEIRGAWYLHPTDDLLEEMAVMVQEQVIRLGLSNDQILFYGSSLGGFGALGMASLLPGSSAIAEIPQIDVSQWPSPGSIKAMENRVLGKTFSEHRIDHPEMVDVRDRFKKSNLIPPFLLVSNETDMSIAIQQDFMADVAMAALPRVGQQRMLLTNHVSGHAALAQLEALALIEQWSERAELTRIEAVRLESIT
ncbi:hypothetical protein KRR55_16485 [Paeniglutamicibacter sp. ABSL32-1]|uniref:hypothetical protein n=1 Tax=Paeniglutamicibacter quisquiliarum TaxID=2849498 RepID=UPI001C2D7225|nr:hypothetical protein [Paeniglutamicibacter quisquiliarum]MBV1780714.1 hypothetical protein [Paeniglutamicibacter quisquiliarum]